jgi:hypothetical protein
VSHDHPRGADLDWYREHLAEDHITHVGDFSRATIMKIHKDIHAAEDLEAQRRIIAPFNDRRPPQPIVIERKRPRREAGADEREFLDASS